MYRTFPKAKQKRKSIVGWRDFGNKTNKMIIVLKDTQLGEEKTGKYKLGLHVPTASSRVGITEKPEFKMETN